MKNFFRSSLKILWLLIFFPGITLAQDLSFSTDSIIYDGKFPKALVTVDFNEDAMVISL